jgi:ABC-2 type transport system ATP-binding protein
MHPLQIDSVVKTFGTRRALDGVSLELRAGELLGLLGPNGAGKSTLVRTIMGRVRPDSGEVRIEDRVAPPGDNGARAQVGVVPQEIALYPNLSSRENLTVFGRYLGMKAGVLDDAIARALEWSALAERADEQVKLLSGGMKRRLNMAAGVLHRPRILLLDEPTVGVDPQSRERIYQMIEGLRADGVSLIYTTHYMEEAERLCDRIAVIDNGRVIATGTKDELVRATIGPRREISVECEAIPDEALLRDLDALGAHVEERRATYMAEHPADAMVKMVKTIESHGVGIRDLTMKSPTLERVFLHLTGRELRE